MPLNAPARRPILRSQNSGLRGEGEELDLEVGADMGFGHEGHHATAGEAFHLADEAVLHRVLEGAAGLLHERLVLELDDLKTVPSPERPLLEAVTASMVEFHKRYRHREPASAKAQLMSVPCRSFQSVLRVFSTSV